MVQSQEKNGECGYVRSVQPGRSVMGIVVAVAGTDESEAE
jgi:hypothetical protein